jgi:hypothetical protein
LRERSDLSGSWLDIFRIPPLSKFKQIVDYNRLSQRLRHYSKNIKPAPDPHYMLEKFCGNLNIQEYRSLLRNERLFIIVDKPLTRILPELHEDNDDFILNTKIIPSNYQLKKKQSLKDLEIKKI